MSEMLNQQLSAFLKNLAGGMYFDKAGRSVDGAKKSRRTASLTVEEIIVKVDKWLFEIWNKTPFGKNEMSPEEAWQDSLNAFPEALVSVQDTEMARYQTSYPLAGTQFDSVRGFRYGGQGYTSEHLSSILRRGERPSGPRLDCMNPSVVWALTKQGPLALRSTQYQFCQGLVDAQLLRWMKDLFATRRTEQANQSCRLEKESRLLRDASKISKCNPVKIASDGASQAIEEQSTGVVDFSDAMDGMSGGLMKWSPSAVNGEGVDDRP